MLDQILEISKTHTGDFCKDIKESSYIQKNICKSEEHNDLTDMIISINDQNYQLLPVSDKSFYLKQKRIEIGSEIEENKSLIESYKFNNYLPIKKIQSGLMKRNSISSLFFLSEYYKCNITLLHTKKNIYYKTLKDYTNKIVIKQNENSWTLYDESSYSDYTVSSIKEFDILKKDIVSYDIYNIPLKSLSSYKLIDLQELADKNGIDIKVNEKNKVKNMLYEELRTYFLNLI